MIIPMDPAEVFKWVKDLGLPVVALYYLFRLYLKEIEKNGEREERYIKIAEECTRAHVQQAIALQALVVSAGEESKARQALIVELFHRVSPLVVPLQGDK